MGREVMECTKIQAEITLRPFELSDVDDFMDWARNNEVTKYCRWNTYTSKEEAVNFLKEVISLYPWYRAICVDNRSIGSIFVMPDMPYLDRIEGLVFAENKASQRVLEKAGFLREGLLRKYFFVKGKSRDIVVFSIVVSTCPIEMEN
ncbi:hypothetical protein IFM89_032483 [Coptis chinensis]|uniref:N-acetyltransferase domain-containing protein n=1 Tax=Coptis chinensis TaxID=261450 RepID=A0A835MD13_9MAGN|nr:hypothetical protein IFM89_032483 [Coptis chinensis]